MSSECLEQGIALSKAGETAKARELFAQLIAADVHHEMAWLWYASTLTTREDVAKALEECLHHNPDCAEAARRLAIVKGSPPTPIQETRRGDRTEAAMMAATKQCPFCAETVKAAAKVCRYCGKDIATQAVMAAEKPQEEKRGSANNWVLVVVFGLLFACLWIVGSGRSGGDSSASDATPAARATSRSTARGAPTQIRVPTATIRAYTYWQIERNYEGMTDAQWNQWKSSIVGGRVRWTAEVIEITGNTLHLAMGSEQPARVYLYDGASALENDVVEGQFIEFEAIIRSVDRRSGLVIQLAETVILDENLPTPTATPTPVPAGMVTVVNEIANLRAGPGTDYEIVGSARNGDELSIYAVTDDGFWYQIDWAGHTWIAAGIVEPSQDVLGVPIAPSQTPTPAPTATPTPSRTPTPNHTATARSRANANAAATVEAYVWAPPVGTWCSTGSRRGVCVGDFRYVNCIRSTCSPSNRRFIAFAVSVRNISSSDITVNPNDVTLVMEDRRSYAYASETFSYWSNPLEHVAVAPGDSAQGGVVFLVPNDLGPGRIIYRGGGLFEAAVEMNLQRPQDSRDN